MLTEYKSELKASRCLRRLKDVNGKDALLKNTLSQHSNGKASVSEEILKSDTGYYRDALSESAVLLKCDYAVRWIRMCLRFKH